jgi:signal transduction histidine kinase/DNA-binding response OmpR family regulator
MTAPDVKRATILIVDDEPANLELLEGFLQMEGYRQIITTADPRTVVDLVESRRPDIILLDLHMPHLDGFEVMQQLAERIPEDEFLPVLVLTADITGQAKARALAQGAKDFLTKPLDEVEVLLRIRNLLETRFLHLAQQNARKAAEISRQHAVFVAEVSHILLSSLDHQTSLARLARATVPEIADYCVIDLVDKDGGWVRAGFAHRQPDLEAPLANGATLWAGVLPRAHRLAREVAEGRFLCIPDLEVELAAAGAGDPPADASLALLQPHSLVCVPLQTSEGIIGEICLAATDPARRYDRGILPVAQEIARRAAQAVENARLLYQAQQASAERDEMLAIVAHDLRNPLNTIRMGVDALDEETDAVARRRYLEIVQRATGRMHQLIQDLLEVTRIRSNKLALELRTESVSPLLSEAVMLLRPLADAARVQLEVDACADLPPVLMDSSRILQVLSNLVGNAIKFTPEGGSIRIGCEAAPDEVVLAISDTGPGIPPERIPHIFGRFWQAQDSDRRGIGLGLSIARGIADAHGGRIWVESRMGEGSTFYFTLRCAAEDGPST